jgi:hypothetical protein
VPALAPTSFAESRRTSRRRREFPSVKLQKGVIAYLKVVIEKEAAAE